MNHRAIAMAFLLGGPPGIGMGLAVLSVSRGSALIESVLIGTIATVLFVGSIYLITARGSIDESPGPNQLS